MKTSNTANQNGGGESDKDSASNVGKKGEQISLPIIDDQAENDADDNPLMGGDKAVPNGDAKAIPIGEDKAVAAGDDKAVPNGGAKDIPKVEDKKIVPPPKTHSRLQIKVDSSLISLQLNPLPPYNLSHPTEVVLEVYNGSAAKINYDVSVSLSNPKNVTTSLYASKLDVNTVSRWSARKKLPAFTEVGTYKLKLSLKMPNGSVSTRDLEFPVLYNPYAKSLGYPTVAWFDPLTVMSGAMTRTINSNFKKPAGDVYDEHVNYTVQKMYDLGIRTIIYSYIEYGRVQYYDNSGTTVTQADYNFWNVNGGFGYLPSLGITHPVQNHWSTGTSPTPTGGLKADMLRTMLKKADELGMSVFVGLGRDEDIYLANDIYKWATTSTGSGFYSANENQYVSDLMFSWRLNRAQQLEMKKTADLLKKYGDHESFVGFYISHEAHDIISSMHYLYAGISAGIKKQTASRLVMVSPVNEPNRLPGDRTSYLPAYMGYYDVDIFAWQDSVGSGSAPNSKGILVETFDPYKRIPGLPGFYAQLSAWMASANALSGEKGIKTLWSNNEAWEMDGTAYYNGTNYTGAFPASFGRLQKQMNASAPYVTAMSVYEFSQNFHTPNDPLLFTDNPTITNNCGSSVSRCFSYKLRAYYLMSCMAGVMGATKYYNSSWGCYY